MRVLLVEDEENLSRLLGKALTSGGFEVVEFATSREALAWSRQNQPDVLVTDVTLDGIDGVALAQAIAQRHPELPVVFISGYPLDIEAQRQKHRRCVYLEKPFLPRTLLRAIAELLAEK